MSTREIEEATRQYFDRIHRAALVLTGNPWDADDLTQETFLLVARKWDDFRGESSTYTWLYGILLNLERRRRRQQGMWRKKFRVLCRDGASRPMSAAPAADAAVQVAEWKRSLWAKVAQLPDGQRQCLMLRFSEGLRYEQIASILECPLGTVKSRIFHGLRALRRMLEETGNEALSEVPDHLGEGLEHAI